MTEFWSARTLANELGHSIARGTEIVGIADASDRTLAVDLRSPAPVPGHSSSAMDGWAVAGEPPWRLGSPIHAGDAREDSPIASGTARPIATGGVVPLGARGVLRSEHGVITDGLLNPGGRARLGEPRAGEHIRGIGEEFGAGQVLAGAGSRLTPPLVALAAIAGHDNLEVTLRPTVDLVVFGSEITDAGVPAAGLVRDAYSPQLPHLLASIGLGIGQTLRAPDDLASTTDAIRLGTATLLVSTGGTARGPADFVRLALDELDAEITIDGVAMRPGHPVVLARLPGDRIVLGLPGNPLAAMLSLLSIGLPLIDGMLGRPAAVPGRVALASDAAHRGTGIRLLPYRWTTEGALPTTVRGSAMLSGLVGADGVAVIPAGGVAAGASVPALSLPW